MCRAREYMLLSDPAVAVAGGTSFALSTTPLPDRVEEDWQLIIATPDPALNGPQISTGSMTLLQVRYYQGTTLLSTDTNPRTVNLPNLDRNRGPSSAQVGA